MRGVCVDSLPGSRCGCRQYSTANIARAQQRNVLFTDITGSQNTKPERGRQSDTLGRTAPPCNGTFMPDIWPLARTNSN